MESMRDIRSHMVSVQKTMKITNAMYLMASSSLKRAKARLEATEPYYNKLQYVIMDILEHTEKGKKRYFATDRDIPPEEIRHGYIIITSDKGLAGAYNLNVNRLAEEHLQKTGHNTLYCIGYTGKKYFSRRPHLGTIDPEHCYSAADPEIWLARRVAEHVTAEFLSGALDEVFIVYTRMVNAISSQAEVIRLLPLTEHMFPAVPEQDMRQYSTDFSPSADAVLDKVAPNYVKNILYGAMVEAYAAEQYARMTAMKNATDNASEIVSRLALEYNRKRQAAITTELTEVVAGANAQEE